MTYLSGYKTAAFNILAVAVAVLQYYGGPLPEVDPEIWAIVIPSVNFILRLVTKTAIFKSN